MSPIGDRRSRSSALESPKRRHVRFRVSTIVSTGGYREDAEMAVDFVVAIHPPLHPNTVAQMRGALLRHNVSLSILATLGLDGLKELTGVQDIAELARVHAALTSDSYGSGFSPPPLGPNGEPVVVRAKVGFTNLGAIDPVGQTVYARFFLNLCCNPRSNHAIEPQHRQCRVCASCAACAVAGTGRTRASPGRNACPTASGGRPVT